MFTSIKFILSMAVVTSAGIMATLLEDIPINFVYLSVATTVAFSILLILAVLLSPFLANRDSRETTKILFDDKRQELLLSRQECDELANSCDKLKEEAVDMKITIARLKNNLEDAYDIISKNNYTGNPDQTVDSGG